MIVSPDQRICKGKSCEPSAILQIHSINVFDKERNPAYFQPLFDFLTDKLQLPENRYKCFVLSIRFFFFIVRPEGFH